MFDRLRFPATLFFAASLLGLLQLYYVISGHGRLLSLYALGYGATLGFIVQSFLRQPLPKLRIAVASFCGSFLLWLPVILVSYGFALTATPIFIAYAVAVVVGSYLASQAHKLLARSHAA